MQPDRREVWPRALGPEPPDMPGRSCEGVDPLFFYPELLAPASRKLKADAQARVDAGEEAAMRVCSGCCALYECRKWVTDNLALFPVGVIGGTSPKARRKLIKQAAREATRRKSAARAIGAHRVGSQVVGVE